MKILFIIDSLRGGGRERRMVQLLHGISKKGESIHMSLIVWSSQGKSYDLQQLEDVDVHYLDSLGDYGRSVFIKKFVSDYKPDIVHCWSFCLLQTLMLLYLKITKKIKLISGYVADGNPSPFFSRGFMTMQLDFLVADAIVSNSKAGLLAKKAPLKKSFIIYNGFDYSRFKAINVPQMRSELLGDYNHLVCMIARFEKSKDWNSFLNLASLSRKNRQNIHFLAVGGGSELDIYKKKAQEMGLNNISFTGFRKDIEDLVRCCDVSVLFSNSEIHAEGVSNSILESMAAGVPVIANNGGGTNEIIVNGKNGYLVDQADYNAAYEYLSLLIQDSGLRMELSKESQKTVKKDFLLSSMTDNYLKLYNSLLT